MKIFRSIEEREAFDAIADKKEREALARKKMHS